MGITHHHFIPVAGERYGCRSVLFCVILRERDSLWSEMILGMNLLTVPGLLAKACAFLGGQGLGCCDW